VAKCRFLVGWSQKAVDAWASTRRSWATPMQVDYVGEYTGKGKGKDGKGKKGRNSWYGEGKSKDGKKGKDGKGKGKKGVKFDGNCNHCGKYGHKKETCWSHINDVEEATSEHNSSSSSVKAQKQTAQGVKSLFSIHEVEEQQQTTSNWILGVTG
jgi:hypothetical protein